MPQTATRAQQAVWAWAGLGLAGSLAVALAGPQLAGGPVGWWYHPTFGGDAALFYAGILALAVAWLGAGTARADAAKGVGHRGGVVRAAGRDRAAVQPGRL